MIDNALEARKEKARRRSVDMTVRWVDRLVDLEKLGISVGTFKDADYGPCEKSTPERPLPRPTFLGAGFFSYEAEKEARRQWLAQFDNDLIPKGDECTGCLYLTQETIRLVNMFGDETGKTRTTIYCDRYDVELQNDLENGEYKKCLLCNGGGSGGNREGATMVLLALLLLANLPEKCQKSLKHMEESLQEEQLTAIQDDLTDKWREN